MAHSGLGTPWYRRSYLTDDGKRALLQISSIAAAAIGVISFLVMPRRHTWQTTSQWKNLERYRYAHRGLFSEPPTAQTYPKGTKDDPFKDTGDTILSIPEKVAQVANKISKNPTSSLKKPLWADDVKNYGTVIPENSLPAFQAAIEAGYGIELDVRMTKDNVLVVVHDSDLERLSGCTGCVEQLTHEELCKYRLLGTDEQIPTLEQVLALYNSNPTTRRRRPPILVEIKPTVGNFADITQLTLLALARFDVDYFIESFDPRVLYYLRRHNPEILRGQISMNYLLDRNSRVYGIPLRIILSSLFANVLSRPDFIAYKFSDRHNPFVWLCCGPLRGHLITWTVRSDSDLAESEQEGAPAIFEHIRPNVYSRLSK